MEEEECIQQVLKLTLIDGSLGVLDLGLNPQFCSHLLQHDDDDSLPASPYPLYKNLASALFKSISQNIHTHKQQEWIQLIRDKGSQLLQVFKMINFHLHVRQPFFSHLKDGLKTVEGRCAVGDYTRMSPGALILFNKCLVLQVQDVCKYASFSEMLEAESIEKVLPGVKALEQGVQIYRNFYPEEKERLSGVLAIRVTKPSSQLSDFMASILRGLSYEGVQRLVGMGIVHTEGTSLVALPPPR
ncbi:ASCH domain-containing protein [Heracleum sosnowskyi]|uniref:ASCH domain-containing protein n=1 Tax=Heracleum sosnowskyi TaxID=360622 RepID=A0AAD8I6G2_9APIA|nr:ASCH domain-containing protein [Heracleum sosnowskyi]